MSDEQKDSSESYRDKLSTLDDKGKRLWLYPKKPNGKYYDKRKLLSYVLLAFLFSAPFIRIGGKQLILLNILERKFNIFGFVFWPQDFHLFVIGMITSIVFVTLFTVIYGRLFCGWVCPQTIFMEMLFRRIEYAIEGDRSHQMALDKAPWNKEKILKKVSKWILFYLISFFIANVFLAYIIGSDELIRIITEPVSQHVGGLTALFIFSGVFYFVFAYFREQVCTAVCPYGRLQGVLLDKQSIIVTYDYKRGEKRALFKKGESRAENDKGDCIDCHQCVDVCPTGIDIRNGTQLECVNCTACMDACDFMMEKVNLKKGLIRHESEKAIAEGTSFQYTTRMKAYTGVLVLLVVVLAVLLSTRSDIETTILRTTGTLYQKIGTDSISNLYNFKIVNKTSLDVVPEFAVDDKHARIKFIGSSPKVEKESVTEGVLIIVLPKEELDPIKTKLAISVNDQEGNQIEKVKTAFLGPNINKQ